MEATAHLIITYRYWILIPLSFIEGPLVAFVAGTLASLGYFNIIFLTLFFLIRDMSMDLASYYLGRYGGQTALAHRLLGKIGLDEEELANIRRLWLNHGGKTMFVSKLSYGVSAAFIIVAGIVAVPLRLFFTYGAAVAVLQYGTLLYLGYFFGNSFGTVSSLFNNLEYVIGGLSVLCIGYYFFRRYMTRRLKRMEEEDRTSV